jgi:site-specific DNA-methyltransferase (cytosine-N4-specific)
MPKSVKDPESNRHEELFLLTPSPRYWFDLDLIREPVNPASQCRGQSADPSHQPVNGVSNRIGAPTCSR